MSEKAKAVVYPQVKKAGSALFKVIGQCGQRRRGLTINSYAGAHGAEARPWNRAPSPVPAKGGCALSGPRNRIDARPRANWGVGLGAGGAGTFRPGRIWARCANQPCSGWLVSPGLSARSVCCLCVPTTSPPPTSRLGRMLGRTCRHAPCRRQRTRPCPTCRRYAR